jgi:iron complex transport system substrate-binding protein
MKRALRRYLFVALFVVLLPYQSATKTLLATDNKLNPGHEPIPQRVVSLSPAATEMLVRLHVGDRLVGITHHSTGFGELVGAKVVGGFLHPDPKLIEALQPDLLIYPPLHEQLAAGLFIPGKKICLAGQGIAEAFAQIRLLGQLFHREMNAEALISEQQAMLDLIKAKVALLPAGAQKKRVARVMSVSPLQLVGDDSFQNELIRAAGGIPPKFGRNGQIVAVSVAQWQQFNPQMIYSCGSDTQISKWLQQPGWREVEAIQQGRIFTYPCELTCRSATHVGDFVAALAADLYRDEFQQIANLVLPEKIISTAAVASAEPLPDYVQIIELVKSTEKDFTHKTLVLHLAEPMPVLSSLEGWREGITTVANHYLPPPSWGFMGDYAQMRTRTLSILGLVEDRTTMLFTGADMDNRAIVTRTFRDLQVTAIVTAGVAGNAMRMGSDRGLFYEPDSLNEVEKPGTINIILLANARLTPRAMTRSLITATEAKSAALQDLDVRSSYQPLNLAATGTGTDNIIVVAGQGMAIDASGGHTKMGELIAQAVHDGVIEAITKQNGWRPNRSVFQRLAERKITLAEVCKNFGQDGNCAGELEGVLLDEKNQNFLLAMMAIQDSYAREAVSDFRSVDLWCRELSRDARRDGIAAPVAQGNAYPSVLAKALATLLTLRNSVGDTDGQ